MSLLIICGSPTFGALLNHIVSLPPPLTLYSIIQTMAVVCNV